MKLSIPIVLLIFFSSCDHQEATSETPVVQESSFTIPLQEFDRREVFFNRKKSEWLLQSDSTLVSGYIVEKYANDRLAKRFGVYEGKKEGVRSTYYSDGRVKFVETYKDNKLDGEVKRWATENGYQLLAHLTYKAGKLHGIQKKWFPTGELHKLMRMNMGKEDGLQQAFRKNGVLYANYEARNGRVFGLKRSNLCYELDNEQIVYKD